MRGALLVTAVLAGCGARSALAVDAAAPGDLAPDAAPDAGTAACVAGSFPLRRGATRALLVVDRSGSMALDLNGANGVPRRWEVLRAVLPDALRRFEAEVSLGAVMFPVGAACGAPTRLDVPFALRNADAVARRLDEAVPNGNTPTYAALVQAERLLAEAPGGGPRAVILATDGAPNCNAGLDGNACVCTAGPAGTGSDECRADPALCLDDRRAVAQVAAMASRGVPTFVIGLDGDRRPELVETLDRIARAGGRPRAAAPARAYYAVRDPAALSAAVDAVASTAARCALATPSRPPPGAAVTLRVGGAVVPRDPTRAEGWDWSAPERAEVSLFGAACDEAARGAAVVFDVACP